MNILFEIADKDLLIIILAFVGILLFGAIIFFAVSKKEKVKPLKEDERFDKEEPTELFTNIKPKNEEQQKAKEELEKVFNQMKNDLEKQKKDVNPIDDFEREQEENAIISYQELIKQAEAKRLRDNGLIEKTKAIEVKKIENDEDEPKKFKNSAIISPVYGIQKNEKQIKPKHAYEEYNSSYDEDDDFLKSLKEFRNNL